MTMQGISNVLPKAAAAVAEKSEKAKGTLFEAVMSSQGNCLLYTSPSPRDCS